MNREQTQQENKIDTLNDQSVMLTNDNKLNFQLSLNKQKDRDKENDKDKDKDKHKDNDKDNQKDKENDKDKEKLTTLLSHLPNQISQQLTITIKQLNTSIQQSIPHKYHTQIYQSLILLIQKSTQPQIKYFNFNKGNNLNLYPIFGIVAWNDIEKGYPIVSWKLCSWLQSGGVRCVPIVELLVKDDKYIQSLKQQLFNVHAIVIPSITYSQTSINFLDILLKLIKQSQHKITILSFGKSSQYILQKTLHNNIVNKKQHTTIKPYQSVINGRVLSKQNSSIYSSIDTVVQMKYLLTQIQFTSFVDMSSCLMDWNVLEQNQNIITVESFLLTKNIKDQSLKILPYFLKHQLSNNITIYHSLLQLYTTNKQQFFNKLIVNFVDQTKKKQYKIKNPIKFIGHYPLQFKDLPDKAFYKITYIK